MTLVLWNDYTFTTSFGTDDCGQERAVLYWNCGLKSRGKILLVLVCNRSIVTKVIVSDKSRIFISIFK